MSNILICGIESLLASYCVARWLQNPSTRIFYLSSPCPEEEIIGPVIRAMSQLAPAADAAPVPCWDEIANRLCPLCPMSADIAMDAFRGGAGAVSQAWYFASAGDASGKADLLGSLIAACPAFAVREFNYVAVDDESNVSTFGGDAIAGAPAVDLLDEEDRIAQLCRAQGIRHRIFRTSLIVTKAIVAKAHQRSEQWGGAFLRSLSELHSFKAEIEERTPHYFDYHALRCLVPMDRVVNLLPAAVASELLLRIARNDATDGRRFSIINPQPIRFSDLCERISMVYGLSILPVDNFGALNAVDRAFHGRAVAFGGLFAESLDLPNREAYEVADLPPEKVVFDEEAQLELLESVFQYQEEDKRVREQRIANLPATMTRREVARDGSGLITYYVAGTAGPVVVLLNALGQGMEFWCRLIDRLMERYRILIWELRGTVSPPPPFGLAEQVSDLNAILRNENIDTCHLAGWCTGPKIAIDFYISRPQMVRSMAFLNSTFKCHGSPEELDTSYEHNLEFLCRRVVSKPAMAASIMKTLLAPGKENERDTLEGADSEEMSKKVLSTLNANIKSSALAPFRTEETTLNYAHQLTDFWSNDIRCKAGEVQVPVLLMSAELDEVVSPASSQMAAELFPSARHVHVPAATHYCLYERPEFVARLLDSFFQNSNDVSVADDVSAAAALP